MPNRHSDQTGFTLLELLIVISIIAVITASIVPSFAGYIKNQGVIQATEQLRSDLRSVQNKALTGSLSDQLVSGNPVQYWGIRFSAGSGTGSSRYEYFVSDAVSCPSAAAIPVAQLQGYGNLPQGIEVKDTSGYACIFFNMANGSASSANITGNKIIVRYAGSDTTGDCRNLLFNANGLIYSSTSTQCT